MTTILDFFEYIAPYERAFMPVLLVILIFIFDKITMYYSDKLLEIELKNSNKKDS